MALPTWFYLIQWITISCVMILLNKAILTGWGFSFPCFLTAWHMIFSTILTQILVRTTKLLPAANEGKVTGEIFKNKIVPIAALFSVSLMMGNMAYLYLSVSFIQMLKAFIPVCVLILGIFIGIDNPSRIQLAIVSMISTGVFISSYGELLFSLTGFLFQLGAIFAESSRLVLSDRLLKDLKLDALSMVYYQSPVCFLFISVAFILFELDRFPITIFMDKFLLGMLLLSGIAAFGLNIAVVLLITHSSALTMTLGGIAKDILLVILSMIIFLSPVTPTQMFGYSISLSGMNLYKNFKSDPAGFSDSTMRYLYYILPCLKARPEIAQVSGGKEANDIADQEAGTLLTQIKSKD